MKAIDIVIDIETLSLRPNALITSIGAVAVDREELEIIGSFETDVPPPFGGADDYHIDPQTIAWQLSQGEKAREELMAALTGEGYTDDALNRFKIWIDQVRSDADDCTLRFWGNGPHFDITILEHAFEADLNGPPWEFHEVRDIRTLMEVTGVNWKEYLPAGEAHSAISDAMAEAKGLIEAFRVMHGLWAN